MIPKLERKAPAKGESIEEFFVPERFREFLRANEGKRVSVLFKPGKRGRLIRVTVNYVEHTCGCCSPSFVFSR